MSNQQVLLVAISQSTAVGGKITNDHKIVLLRLKTSGELRLLYIIVRCIVETRVNVMSSYSLLLLLQSTLNPRLDRATPQFP